MSTGSVLSVSIKSTQRTRTNSAKFAVSKSTKRVRDILQFIISTARYISVPHPTHWRSLRQLAKIDDAIKTGAFAKNDALVAFANKLAETGGTAHLMGVMSPGGVHAHHRHIAAAAKAPTEKGIGDVLHLFIDGRDTPPKSAAGYLKDFEAALGNAGQIATVSGRFYAMDRDNRWERVSAAYEAITSGKGAHAPDADTAIANAYGSGDTDEFIPPTIIGDYTGAADGDGVMFLNFRADRARELLSIVLDPEFDQADIEDRPTFAASLGVVEYSDRHNEFMTTMFPSTAIQNTLGEWVAAQGKRQLRLAETEKYPHVTFFLNGGEEAPAIGEDRHMAPSPKVRTYDLAPEMASGEVTTALVKGINDG